MSQVLIYLEDVDWELDYLSKDILRNYQISPPVILSKEQYCDLNFWMKEEYKLLIGNNIMIFNYLIPYLLVKPVVEYLRPNVIFFMSDERADCVEYNELSKHTKLFFRQYHMPYISYPNIFQIPLGYMKNFMQNVPHFKNSVEVTIEKRSSDRSLSWAFIGSLKADRQEMLDQFSAALLGNHYISYSLPSSEIHEIYTDSVFVPCGRGNLTLDCLRLYEAAICGAIPVVAGPENEVIKTFYYDDPQNLPPWIYAPNWSVAAIHCKQLLDKPDLLNGMQESSILWWKNINARIQNKISAALNLKL